MEKNSLITLRIMEEVQQKNNITQRELAGKLDISIGTANIFIKRIIRKGYFKATTIPRHRIRYIFTPTGMLEKSRLTIQYLHHSLDFYNDLKVHIAKRLEELEDRNAHRIAFYGTGEISELSYLYIRSTQIALVAIADDNPDNNGQFLNFKIISPSMLCDIPFDVVLVTDLQDAEGKVNTLLSLGIERGRIMTF